MYISHRRKSESKMHGKIIQRLKAIVFKLLMAGQEKVSEKNPEVSTFSCILDWNKLKTFHIFFFKRRTWAHNPFTGSQISNRHFFKALLWDMRQKLKRLLWVTVLSTELLDFRKWESLSHSLTLTRIPFWISEVFCKKYNMSTSVLSSNKSAFLDREQDFREIMFC